MPEPVTAQKRIAIVLREDLATWQRINVAAFLASAVASGNAEVVGEPYRDALGRTYSRMFAPVMVFETSRDALSRILVDGLEAGLGVMAFPERLFITGNDSDNRAAFAALAPAEMDRPGWLCTAGGTGSPSSSPTRGSTHENGCCASGREAVLAGGRRAIVRAKTDVRADRAPRATDWLLFLVPSLIWGTTWFAIKFQLGVVAPEASVAYRFFLAALLLLGWSALQGLPLRFDARTHASLVLLGLLQYGVNYVLVYRSEQHLTSGLVAMIFGLLVVWNLLGARLLFGSRATASVLSGAAIGVLGVVLVVWPDLERARFTASQALGVVLAVAGTMSFSAGNLWSQRVYQRGTLVIPSTGWAMLYGALGVTAWCMARGISFAFDPSIRYLISLGYLALFGSVFAFITYLTLVKRIGAGRAGYTAVVIPVLAMAMSTLFETYRWSMAALAGMTLVLAGNLLVLRRSPPGRIPANELSSASDPG